MKSILVLSATLTMAFSLVASSAHAADLTKLPPKGESNAIQVSGPYKHQNTVTITPESVNPPYWSLSDLVSNDTKELLQFTLSANSNVSLGINQWPYNGGTSGVKIEYFLTDLSDTAKYWYVSNGYFKTSADTACYWSNVPPGTYKLKAWNIGSLDAGTSGNVYW